MKLGQSLTEPDNPEARWILALLFCSAILLAGLLLNSPLVYASSIVLFTAALTALGAQRSGTLGPLRWPLVLLFSSLLATVDAVVLSPESHDSSRLIFGVPAAIAVTLFGVWLAPLPIALLSYVLVFDRFTLTESDLQILNSFRQQERR